MSVGYLVSSTLNAVDMNSAAVVQVDASVVNNTGIDWSPDGKKLVFVSTRNGNQNLYVFDATNRVVTKLTDSTNTKSALAWSPDGGSIAYIRSESDGTNALWLVDPNGSNNRLVLQKLPGIVELKWKKSGELLYVDVNGVHEVYVKTHFIFKGVSLDQGDNNFHAKAGDVFGNITPPSAAITVSYDTSLMPDVAVSFADIFVYPPYPKPGEEVIVTAAIKNPRQVAVDNVDVDLYLWDSAGELKLLKSETIARLAANSEETVSASVNAGSQTGVGSVIVVVDPADKLKELLESNNSATKEIYVTDKEEVAVVTSLDDEQYASHQDAAVHVTLRNSGMAKEGLLTIGIEDGSGYGMTLLDTVSTPVPYGEDRSYGYTWNTAATFAGSYRVHAVFVATDGAVSEGITPFKILPDVRVDSGVVTDKLGYGANDKVAMTISLKNSGSNYVVPQLDARVRIVDSGDTTLFADERTVQDLFPAAGNSLQSEWSTGLHTPGEYRVVVEAYLGDKLVSSSTARFTIRPVAEVSGSVTVDPATVLFGDNLRTAFAVANTGNTDVGGVVKSVIIDPATQTIVAAAVREVALAMNSHQTGDFVFSSQKLELKPYLVNLQYLSQGREKSLASASFTVKDGTPPVVSIVAPTEGAPYSSTVPLVVLASDDASGVEKVEYRLDNGAWNPLSLVDPVSGRYAAAWESATADNGGHNISFRGSDRAGNKSVPVTVRIEVRTDNVPPTTVITASDPLAEGAVTTVSPKTTFTLVATDNMSGVKGTWYRIDHGQWQLYSEAFTLSGHKAGAHAISFSSSDNAENSETEHFITVRLVLAEVEKDISPEPVVLVGAWEDGANKVKNQSAIGTLSQILSSLGISYHIAENADDFKLSLRSERYTMYILVDYKDEKVGEEVREAVNYGDSLVYIKTQPTFDPVLNETFGVKFTGKATSDNLPITFLESPIGSAGTMQGSGKPVVIGEVVADTARIFGQVDDKHNLYPALIFNEYGAGKVVLYTFDLLGSPDKQKVADLLSNSIALLKPEQHRVRALGSVPVRVVVANSTEPFVLQVTETIPAGTTADTVTPQGTATDTTIAWQQYLEASASVDFGYHLNLPDARGEYTTTAVVSFASGDHFRPYETSNLTVTVEKDSAELLQTVIADLRGIPAAGPSDLALLGDALGRLSQITVNPLDGKEAERSVEAAAAVTALLGGLTKDTSGIRLELDELLKILEKKWYLINSREKNRLSLNTLDGEWHRCCETDSTCGRAHREGMDRVLAGTQVYGSIYSIRAQILNYII
jgi:PHD/YefM family antitoxin component YafN of YafNO toxin-antitoxin module